MAKVPRKTTCPICGESENWKQITGFASYWISSHGSIASQRRRGGGDASNRHDSTLWQPLSPLQGHNGYLYVKMVSDQGKRQTFTMHKLVLWAFRGSRRSGFECRHLDGDSTNNHLDNLVWGTPTEQVSDKLRHGTMFRGEPHNKTTITEAQVVNMRGEFAAGTSASKLAEQYGLTRPTIYKIVLPNQDPRV